MPTVKCPNPQCPFVFDPSLVPHAAVLSCPRCSMRFTLAPAPEVAAAGHFNAGELPSIPADFQPTLPISSATVATPGPVAASPGAVAPQIVRRAGRTGGGPSRRVVWLGVAVGAIVTAVAVAALSYFAGGKARPGAAEEQDILVADKNFAYKLPAGGWKKDLTTQNEMGVNVVVLRRLDPPQAWFALAVSDYDTRSPLQTELRDELYRHLNRLFQFVAPDLTFEPARWGPHEAKKAFFRGELKTTGAVCVGEAYVLSHKGVGYWCYTWAAEAEAGAVAAELDAMRERFRTLDVRQRWSEKVSNEVTFRGVKPGGKFRLSTYEKIWAAPDLEPTDEDPRAELLLKGVIAGRGKRDFNPEALLVVLVLPSGGVTGDAAAVADKAVRARHTRDPELFGPTLITGLTSEPAGDAPIGPETAGAPVKRLKVSPGGPNASKVSEKLVAYTAMKIGDAVVVAEANCPWSQREIWERRLVQFVGTLRP